MMMLTWDEACDEADYEYTEDGHCRVPEVTHGIQVLNTMPVTIRIHLSTMKSHDNTSHVYIVKTLLAKLGLN